MQNSEYEILSIFMGDSSTLLPARAFWSIHTFCRCKKLSVSQQSTYFFMSSKYMMNARRENELSYLNRTQKPWRITWKFTAFHNKNGLLSWCKPQISLFSSPTQGIHFYQKIEKSVAFYSTDVAISSVRDIRNSELGISFYFYHYFLLFLVWTFTIVSHLTALLYLPLWQNFCLWMLSTRKIHHTKRISNINNFRPCFDMLINSDFHHTINNISVQYPKWVGEKWCALYSMLKIQWLNWERFFEWFLPPINVREAPKPKLFFCLC